MVEIITAESVTYLLDAGLRQLKIEGNDMLLLFSDAAADIKSARELLKIINSRLFHLTYFCHLLHNVCLSATTQSSAINDIIPSIKSCTVKNNTRQYMFHHLGTIRDPVLTSLETWISCSCVVLHTLVGDKAHCFVV